MAVHVSIKNTIHITPIHINHYIQNHLHQICQPFTSNILKYLTTKKKMRTTQKDIRKYATIKITPKTYSKSERFKFTTTAIKSHSIELKTLCEICSLTSN